VQAADAVPFEHDQHVGKGVDLNTHKGERPNFFSTPHGALAVALRPPPFSLVRRVYQQQANMVPTQCEHAYCVKDWSQPQSFLDPSERAGKATTIVDSIETSSRVGKTGFGRDRPRR
jgi:hypothetical protein